LLKATPGLLAQ